MRILMITPYVTIAGIPEFERNKTGFGYMVHDIAQAVGALEQVDVLATDSRGRSFYEQQVCYLERSLSSFAFHLSRILPLSSLLDLLRQYKVSKGSWIRLWYYWLMSGYVCSIIKKGKYDIVHIHGCAYSNELWINACKRYEVKYIITFHGLNSFSDTVHVEAARKQYERDFLKRVVEYAIPITVISTGMKRQIETSFSMTHCKSINVVSNSFSFGSQDNEETLFDIRKQYLIDKDSKILLYVGNITKNKNQSQMVRVFSLLPEQLREKTYVLFCGANFLKEGDLGSLSSSVSYGNHLIFCGNIEKEKMPSYYKGANGVVLLSFAEGFGLSLIEGMHFGLPCAMPIDLDAFEDIYDPCSVQPILGRDDNSVVMAMEALLTKEWNKNTISSYSDKFSSSTMAQKYIRSYQL